MPRVPKTLTPKLREVCEKLGIDVSGYKAPAPYDWTRLVDTEGHCQPSPVELYPARDDDHARALRAAGLPALADPFGDAFPAPTQGVLGGVAAYLSPISHNSTFNQNPNPQPPRDKDGKPLYWCQRSRFLLAGPAENGTRIVPAPCNANSCEYCGRVKMYRKRNRMYESFEEHRAWGALDEGRYLFITVDFRPSLISHADAFRWAKPALAYAFQQIRKPRNGKKSRGKGKRKRGSWPGLVIGYCNDIDLQPGTKMAHGHCIALFQPLKGHILPPADCIAREMHHHISNFLYRKLGKQKLRRYRRSASPCFVDVRQADNEKNVANYMALHNQKIFEPWREYPRKYRRFAASKGFLVPLPEKQTSGWVFLPLAASAIAATAVATGRTVLDVESKGERVTGYTVAVPWASDDAQRMLGILQGETCPVSVWQQRSVSKGYRRLAQHGGMNYYDGPDKQTLDRRQASLISRAGHDPATLCGRTAYFAKVGELERQWALDAKQTEAHSLGLSWADYESWEAGKLGDAE